VPVFTAATEPEALEVICETASRQGSACQIVHPEDVDRILGPCGVPLPGRHQRLNAALAVTVVRALLQQLPVRETQLREGLESVVWAGRQQVVRLEGGRTLLLDGAHNIAGVETLASGVSDLFGDAKPCLILGMLQDKDWRQMCGRLVPLAGRVFLVPVASERTAGTGELADFCRERARLEVREFPSLAAAWEAAAAEPRVVIAGSLYLVGEAMEVLHLISPGSTNERGLNEWGGSPARP
jgi:dihydrofolate synthase/folylpolyglutamate synthase